MLVGLGLGFLKDFGLKVLGFMKIRFWDYLDSNLRRVLDLLNSVLDLLLQVNHLLASHLICYLHL